MIQSQSLINAMQKMWTGRDMQTDNMVAFVISRLERWQVTSSDSSRIVFLKDSMFYSKGLGGNLGVKGAWEEIVDKTIERERQEYMMSPLMSILIRYEHTPVLCKRSIQHLLTELFCCNEFLAVFCFFLNRQKEVVVSGVHGKNRSSGVGQPSREPQALLHRGS